MKLSYAKLHESFFKQSVWTNSLIERGYQAGLGIMEETITNLNLIEIANQNKEFVITKEFSKKEEGSTSGADWLWFIGEPGSWFPLLVQAKIVNPKSKNCYHLNYRSGMQRKLLIEFARKYKFFPIYCIYSYISPSFHPNAKLSTSLSKLEDYEWACSYISPKQVRQLTNHGVRSQINLLRFGIPWTFPLKYAMNCEGTSLAKAISEGFKLAKDELQELETVGDNNKISVIDGKARSKNIRWEDPDPRFLICRTIPKIFIKAVQGKISPKQVPVAGISIISSISVNEAIEHPEGFPALEGVRTVTIQLGNTTKAKTLHVTR